MASALLVIDLQNDFVATIPSGETVARAITNLIRADAPPLVIASRDWHHGDNDNGGHFPPAPEGSSTPWVTHCVAESVGAEYHDAFDDALVDVHIKKGQGRPDYSIFCGITDEGEPFADVIARLGVDSVTVCGLATEFCVRAASLDALAAGLEVTVRLDLSGGYSEQSRVTTAAELRAAGATVIE